jgi:predicted ATPase
LAVAFGDERDKPFENRHALSANTPVLCQLKPVGSPMKAQLLSASEFSDFLASIRFLDLSPDEMKRPSLPGQLMLGDRGENLSSVLMAICADADSKRGLTEWLQELTPVDVIDLDFVEDQQGRVSVTLVEASGTRTSVHSASDGTLRFLGLLAALMGPKRPRVLFLDEIDTGIHPARLHLLVQLIEHHTAKGDLQVIATTHSPQLLALLSERSRNDAVLVYRLHGATDAGIKRIVDIPHAREVLQNESLSRLHETGWLENAVEFAHAEPAS